MRCLATRQLTLPDVNMVTGMSFSIAWLAEFFAEESKLIARRENAYKSNRVEEFRLDVNTALMTGRVKSSLKDKLYSIEVRVTCFRSVVFTKSKTNGVHS